MDCMLWCTGVYMLKFMECICQGQRFPLHTTVEVSMSLGSCRSGCSTEKGLCFDV